MEAEHIIIYPQNIGDTTYLPADRIDIVEACKRGLLNERLVFDMKQQDKIAVATPEVFRIAVARRPAGSAWPPRGFTEAYLMERGWIDPETAPEAPKPTKAKTAVILTRIDITPEAIHVGDYRLQPTKRRHFTFWAAADATGKILRAALFKSSAAGVEWLEDLVTRPASPATSGQDSEANHDGDVRSNPGASQG